MNNIDLYVIDSFISACLIICLTLTKADNQIPTENIARSKRVFQSSIHNTLSGANAVDGSFEQTYTKCAHGNDNSGGPNWLVVDLNAFYRIHHVILTPRRETHNSMPENYEYSNHETHARMQYVYIGVTNEFIENSLTPVRHNYPLCRQWPYKTNISQNLTITCRPNTPPGRYLIVQQPIDGPGKLTICEIQIFGKELKKENGKCQNGYYGQKCDKQCNCYKGIECDKLNGTCLSGCDENWEELSCSKRRANYTKLIVGCFHVEVDRTVDILTPRYTSCLDQCSENGFNFASVWETTCYCTDYIDWSSTRENCDSSCIEATSSDCLHLTTRILLSVCPNGTYGYNCTLKCNCLNNGRCSYLNGSCNQGCKPGWIGEACNIRDCSSNNGDCEGHETCISNASDVSSCYCNTTFFSRKKLWSACEDIDECQVNSSCNVEEFCNNFEGGYECISKAVSLTEVVYILIAIAVILLLLVTVLLILKFIRRHKLNGKSYNSSKINSSDYVASSNSGAPPKITELYLEDFPAYVAEKKYLFSKEFKELPDFDYSIVFAQKQPKSLNRFKNIVPYDKNRVKLKAADEEASDYINASYIKNVLQATLIATQGPTKESVQDFWRMIWQESVGIIVMLCNLVEMAKIKCEDYWPRTGNKSYGDIKITYVKSYDWPEYKVTHLILEKDDYKQDITHLHYTKWPDHDAPQHISYFLAFNRHFRKLYEKQKCSVVVHCSAGVGRTGSFIAVTDLITRGLAGKPINVSGCVSKLRESRMKMVQKEVQFGFIYDCLAHEATLGQTNFDLQDFQIFFSDRKKFRQKIENQYKRLQTLFDKEHFKERHFIEVVTSTRKFQLIHQPTSNEFWAEISAECDLVIVLGEFKEYFPESNHSLETENFVVSLVNQETDTNAQIFQLQISNKNDSNTYANAAIYENNDNLTKASSKRLSTILIQSKDMEATMDYPTFNELFRIMKANSLTALMSSYDRLAGFFMTLCNIIDQLTFRNEVAVFQNVLEIQSDKFHYSPTLDEYEKLHELVIEYLKDEMQIYFSS